jgi:hypothetical protein
MGTRVFAQRGDFRLVGDECDVMVDWHQRMEVWDWCDEHGIDIEYSDSAHISKYFGVDLWRVKDERQRVLFILKWGNEDSSCTTR